MDEDNEVAAWIIEAFPRYVLILFADGRSTYATHSTEDALAFVSNAAALDCRLVAMITGEPSEGHGEGAELWQACPLMRV
ncbi:hypothetical protein [Actinosynnema sp. NPDC023587]|uniref:hypothetical protein n=1 Tax=Actinosynnema sp. NPDC023587 TaxID=3154695 RepID=UPI0034014387